jgi:hypothetical protein
MDHMEHQMMLRREALVFAHVRHVRRVRFECLLFALGLPFILPVLRETPVALPVARPVGLPLGVPLDLPS